MKIKINCELEQKDLIALTDFLQENTKCKILSMKAILGNVLVERSTDENEEYVIVSKVKELETSSDKGNKAKIPLSEIVKNENMVVHTPKREQFRILIKSCGSRLDTKHWDVYKEQTCVHISGYKYCSLSFFKNICFTIVEFDDVDL